MVRDAIGSILISRLFVWFFLLAWTVGLPAPAGADGARPAAKWAGVLESAAAQMNSRLPIRIDPVTELVKVEKTPDGMIFTHRVNTTGITVSPNIKDAMRSDLINSECKKRSVAMAMGDGWRFLYRYFDHTGHLITEVELVRGDCP